jgi:hypothetical protein
MKITAKLFGSLLLVATIAITPSIVRSQDLSIPFDDKAYKFIEQIQDLELMGRDIERCYEAEKRTAILASLSRQSVTDSTQFNSELIDRVFGNLVGTPEYERFVMVYRALVRSPGYKQVHSANLFDEYRRLIESARTRLTTQLQERLKSLAKGSSSPFYPKSGFSESGPLNIVVRQHLGAEKTAQSEAVSPKITEDARAILITGGKGKDLTNYLR